MQDETTDDAMFACPCCGYKTFDESERGSFDICPVCFWEDDNLQFFDPDRAGGANKVSLNEARKNHLLFGAKDERSKGHVRRPFPDEL